METEIRNYFVIAGVKGDRESIRVSSHSKLEYAHKEATHLRLDEGYTKENNAYIIVLAGLPCRFDFDTLQYKLPDGLTTTNGSDEYRPKPQQG